MSFKFSNVIVLLFLLIFVNVTENRMFLVETGEKDTDDGKTVKKIAEKEIGQDYSDDDDIALEEAVSRFNPVIHKRKYPSHDDDKESFWNREGNGFEPEIVDEDDSYWNRVGNVIEPEVVTETGESSTNSTEGSEKGAEDKKEPDYDIPSDFLKMLTKPAE